jgi:hypothetical protein
MHSLSPHIKVMERASTLRSTVQCTNALPPHPGRPKHGRRLPGAEAAPCSPHDQPLRWIPFSLLARMRALTVAFGHLISDTSCPSSTYAEQHNEQDDAR